MTRQRERVTESTLPARMGWSPRRALFVGKTERHVVAYRKELRNFQKLDHPPVVDLLARIQQVFATQQPAEVPGFRGAKGSTWDDDGLELIEELLRDTLRFLNKKVLGEEASYIPDSEFKGLYESDEAAQFAASLVGL